MKVQTFEPLWRRENPNPSKAVEAPYQISEGVILFLKWRSFATLRRIGLPSSK